MQCVLGFDKYSVLGWSDGGITGMILTGDRPKHVAKLVIWGANAFVTQEDVDLISKVGDLSKWNAKMREPLESKMPKLQIISKAKLSDHLASISVS